MRVNWAIRQAKWTFNFDFIVKGAEESRKEPLMSVD